MKSKNKKLAAVITAAVALVLAAAIIVTCIVIKRSSSDSGDTLGGSGKDAPVLSFEFEKTNDEVSYETAVFEGYTMPADFVEIMKEAKTASEKACADEGIALSVGETDISVSEFAMSFYDTYTNAVYDYSSNTQTTKGLRTDSLPSEQNYTGNVTWKDRLEELTVEDIREKYVLAFDALSKGFVLSNETYELIAKEFADTLSYVESKGMTADEYVQSVYCVSVPYVLYQRSFILMYYADEYEKSLLEQMRSQHTMQEVEQFYSETSALYDYVDVYVMFFNMGATIDPSQYSHIKTKDDFIDFHYKYYEENNYPSNIAKEDYTWTMCTYKEIGSSIGRDVADWCFSPERKAGDICTVSGVVYECLVFMDKPAYKQVSVDFLDCTLYYSLALQPTDELKIKHTAEEMAKVQKEFEQSDKSAEAFIEIGQAYSQSFSFENDCLNSAVRLSNEDEYYDKATLRWCFEEGRKAGDYTCIESQSGYQFVYFLNKNEGDFDYIDGILNQFSQKDFDEYLNTLLEYQPNVTTINHGNCAVGSQAGEEAVAIYVKQSNM